MATLTGFDNVNDRLEGGEDPDIISGLSGDDNLIGGGGRDTINGGDGDDIMYAGGTSSLSRAQDDVLNGGAGIDRGYLDYSDLVWVGSEKPITIFLVHSTATYQIQIDGYVGATLSGVEKLEIRAADGNDTITGGNFDDFLDVRLGQDFVNARGGNDRVYDTGGKATLDGGAGQDFLSLSYGAWTGNFNFDLASGIVLRNSVQIGTASDFEQLSFFGGEGNDTIIGGLLDDDIRGNTGKADLDGRAGNDTLSNTGTHSTIDGGNGNDRIITGDGIDRLNGDAGNDYIEGGKGSDTIDGGTGNDTIFGDNTSFGANNDVINGGSGDDVITTGNPIIGGTRDTVSGGAGTDTLIWNGGFEAAVNLHLNSGSAGLPGGGTISGFEIFDITSGSFDDFIAAAGGNDTLEGAGGNDTLQGGGGNDLLRGNIGSDSVDGGAGNDSIYAITQFFGNDTGLNTLNGGAGDDFVVAQVGDNAFGGTGRDVLLFSGDSGPEGLNLNLQTTEAVTGFEVIQGSAVGDVIRASNKGGIEIRGSQGNDTLVGSVGEDTIWGETGQDRIKLGAGEDHLVLFQLFEDGDTIVDFNPDKDTLELRGFQRRLPLGEIDPSRLVIGDFGDTPPTATVASTQFFYDSTDGRLFVDWDGTETTNYTATLLATFENLPDLTAADFVIVDKDFQF